jgi:hypothetical protein
MRKSISTIVEFRNLKTDNQEKQPVLNKVEVKKQQEKKYVGIGNDLRKLIRIQAKNEIFKLVYEALFAFFFTL